MLSLKEVVSNMADKAYWQKLKDPRWQKLRLEAMQKADFKCEICRDDESSLNVHHKEYFKGHEPWEYDVNQLSVLCEPCHESYHDEFNVLRWVSSLAPLEGPGNRIDLSYLMAGFLNINYEGMLSVACHSDYEYRRLAFDLGVKAREEIYG